MVSMNDLFFFILIASVHNFAGDNTLPAFAENISKLVIILQSESVVITDWFKKNQAIVSFKQKKILINSYFMANFNYFSLVWMFPNAVSLKKIENLQKGDLRFLYKSCKTSYEDLLLNSGHQ